MANDWLTRCNRFSVFIAKTRCSILRDITHCRSVANDRYLIAHTLFVLSVNCVKRILCSLRNVVTLNEIVFRIRHHRIGSLNHVKC